MTTRQQKQTSKSPRITEIETCREWFRLFSKPVADFNREQTAQVLKMAVTAWCQPWGENYNITVRDIVTAWDLEGGRAEAILAHHKNKYVPVDAYLNLSLPLNEADQVAAGFKKN